MMILVEYKTIVMLFLLIILLLMALLVSVTNNISSKDSGKNKQWKKNVTTSNQAYNTDREAAPKISYRKSQQDEQHHKHNVQHPEVRQQAEQHSLSVPKIVINAKSEYEPELLDEPIYFQGINPDLHNGHYLIIDKNACKKLMGSLDWGTKTKRNRVEQGGVLLGHIAYYGKEIYCFVSDTLLADTAGSPVFVEFTSEMWAAMQNGLAKINAALGRDEQLVIVGWFHTHPNNLSVFMSGTDMKTQRLNFSQEWQASLVMNPHTGKYRVFFGAQAMEGMIIVPNTPVT